MDPGPCRRSAARRDGRRSPGSWATCATMTSTFVDISTGSARIRCSAASAWATMRSPDVAARCWWTPCVSWPPAIVGGALAGSGRGAGSPGASGPDRSVRRGSGGARGDRSRGARAYRRGGARPRLVRGHGGARPCAARVLQDLRSGGERRPAAGAGRTSASTSPRWTHSGSASAPSACCTPATGRSAARAARTRRCSRSRRRTWNGMASRPLPASFGRTPSLPTACPLCARRPYTARSRSGAP